MDSHPKPRLRSPTPSNKNQTRLPAFIHWLLPNKCGLCGQISKSILCADCEADIPYLGGLGKGGCQYCSIPIHTTDSNNTLLACGQCLGNTPSFDSSKCLTLYNGAIPYLINQFKHQGQKQYGRFLADTLAEKVLNEMDFKHKPDVITYVPIHWTRYIARGFNQAQLIAERIGLYTDIPVRPLLRKVHMTQKQQGMDRKQRLRNIKHSFALNTQENKYSYIALTDDVITTGATIESIAYILKQSGAQKVCAWALSRTPPSSYI